MSDREESWGDPSSIPEPPGGFPGSSLASEQDSVAGESLSSSPSATVGSPPPPPPPGSLAPTKAAKKKGPAAAPPAPPSADAIKAAAARKFAKLGKRDAKNEEIVLVRGKVNMDSRVKLKKVPKQDPLREKIETQAAELEKGLKKFVADFSAIESTTAIIQASGSLADILFAVGDADDTAIAFDFDQTITLLDKSKPVGKRLSLRGGEASRKALLSLKAKGIPMFVITAQPPSIKVVKSMAEELRRLGLDAVFGVEPFDPAPVWKLIKSWGRNETLSTRQLLRKLIALLILTTDRWAADLTRVTWSHTIYETTEGAQTKYEHKRSEEEAKRIASIQAEKEHEEENKRRNAAGLCNLSEEEDLDQPLDEFDDGRGAGFAPISSKEAAQNVIFRTEIPPDQDMIGKESRLSQEFFLPSSEHRQLTDEQARLQRLETFRTRRKQERAARKRFLEKEKEKDTGPDQAAPRPAAKADLDDSGDEEEEKVSEAQSLLYDSLLCPWRCWYQLALRISPLYAAAQQHVDQAWLKSQPDVLKGGDKNKGLALNPSDPETMRVWGRPLVIDRTFLDWGRVSDEDTLKIAQTTGGLPTELKEGGIEELLESVLTEAKVDFSTARQVFKEQAVDHMVDGILISQLKNTCAARYNKPEAFEFFLRQNNLTPKRLIFVDDNSDNVMNVFMNFVRPALIKQQSKEKEAANTDTLSKESESPAIFSFWFTPPLKQEVHDEVVLQHLERLARSNGMDMRCLPSSLSPSLGTLMARNQGKVHRIN